MAIETTFGRASRHDTFLPVIRDVAAGLIAMGQRVEGMGTARFTSAVAIIVVAQILIAGIGATFGAYMAVHDLRTDMCYANQRIDRDEHIIPPRAC